MTRRPERPRATRAVLSFGFTALALVLGSAAGCYELPPDVIIQEESWGGEAWGGEGSSDDDGAMGGTATGGVGGMGGSSGSGASATGGDGGSGASGTTGGTGNGGEGAASGGGSGGTSGSAGAGSGAGGRGGTGGSGGKAGGGGVAGSAGKAGGGSGGSGGFSTNRDEFFGASRCSSAFDLCDDFEATTLNTTRWRVQGQAPTIDSTRGARGTRSAHFHTTDNGLSLLHATSIFPAANNTYWGRLFVWFDAMPTAPMWAHWTIVGAVGSGTDTEIRLGGQYDGDTNRFGVGTDHGETGDWTNLDEDPGDPVPTDAWVCIEWLHKGDTNETRFFWDGVEHPSLHTTATMHGGPQGEDYVLPEIEDVFVGWWLYQAGTTPPAFDVWIDEVALDGERIGCSR